MNDFARAMGPLISLAPQYTGLDRRHVRRKVGKLVLNTARLMQGLMERRAAMRVQSGALSEEAVARLADTSTRLSMDMERLKKEFRIRQAPPQGDGRTPIGLS